MDLAVNCGIGIAQKAKPILFAVKGNKGLCSQFSFFVLGDFGREFNGVSLSFDDQISFDGMGGSVDLKFGTVSGRSVLGVTSPPE